MINFKIIESNKLLFLL